jgi:hypothetical protein
MNFLGKAFDAMFVKKEIFICKPTEYTSINHKLIIKQFLFYEMFFFKYKKSSFPLTRKNINEFEEKI